MSDTDFAKNLQLLRKQANLSQENLAEHLHISRQAISKWEMGQSSPDIDTCIKLCEVLNVTPNRLFGYEEKSSEVTPAKKPQSNVVLLVTAIFLMVVCACGTILLVCNLYNGVIFEANIHTQATFLIWGSILAFIILLISSFWKKRNKSKG